MHVDPLPEIFHTNDFCVPLAILEPFHPEVCRRFMEIQPRPVAQALAGACTASRGSMIGTVIEMSHAAGTVTTSRRTKYTLLSKVIGNHPQPHQVVSGTGTGPYGIKSDLATNRESPPANPISYVKYAKI